jgi:hypothetical protein
MKRFGVTLFLFVLWLSLSAIAQDTGQQSSEQGSNAQTTTQSTTTQTTTKTSTGKLQHLKGKISDDGKSLTTDKDNKTYTIENPDAVKGHEGHDVRIRGHVDTANNSVHVMSLKMAGMAKQKGTMSEQPPK